MRKFGKVIIALALGCAMLLATACSLVSVNEEKDNAQTVAKVNGVAINKGRFREAFDEIIYYYSMFGMQITAENVAEIRTNTMDSIVMDEVLKQKSKELGFDKLTAEEQTQIDQDFDELWQSYLTSYRTQAESEFTEKGATPSDTELDKRAEELLLEDMKKENVTKDQLKQNSIDQQVYTKLRDSVYNQVSVTEEEIKADYEKKLTEQKTKYDETPGSYESDAASATIAYVPPGYVYVKHILIKPEDSDQDYTDYNTKLTTLATERQEFATEMANLIADDKIANQAKIDELEAKINAGKQEEATMREQFLAKLKPQADEALAKAKAGEDFDQLIEEYGKDPGMTTSPNKETGYLLSKFSSSDEGGGMDADFTKASMALMNVGDITDLVPTQFGFHIIKLVEKVASGNVPLDNIKEDIRQELLETKQNELWTARQEEWKNAAKLETFPDIVKDVGTEAM